MHRIVTLLFITAFAFNSFAAENEAVFLKYRKKAVLEKKVPDCNVYNIPLDNEIYKNTGPDFSDMRLLDPEGAIVPFELTRAAVTRRDTSFHVFSKMLSIKKNPESNSVEIVLEIKSDLKEIAILRINTRDENFEKTISVFTSDDSVNWILNTENARIFDYSGIADVSCSTVEIKPVLAKYFKVVVGNFTETEKAALSSKSRTLKGGKLSSETINSTELDRVIRIDSIDLRYIFMRSYDLICEYPVSVKSIVNKDKETVITLESDRQPFTSFTIISDSPGFVRQASVDIPDDDNKYSCIGSEKIFCADTPGSRKNTTKVAFGERRCREYRIRIANAENPPLENIRIKAEGPQYQLTLLASARQGPFYVCYGGELDAPSYDVKDVLRMLKQKLPASFSLGPEEANPGYRKPVLYGAGPLGKYLFYGGVLLMVVALGIVLAFYFRKVEAASE